VAAQNPKAEKQANGGGAQKSGKTHHGPVRPPDFANVSYGPYKANVLDLYLAKADKPTPLVLSIHGGAFLHGNKSDVQPSLLDACSKAGITLASIEYRLADVATYPAPFADCARALQYLRFHARDYNLDPKRVASTGGSAGGCISLWLGFHDDMADPQSGDPVMRQSTRLSVVGGTAAQTTLDPRIVKHLIGDSPAIQQVLRTLFGVKQDEIDTERAQRLYDDESAIVQLTKDDPPVFLYYWVSNKPLTPASSDIDRIHHPAFGFYLKERMDKLGIECEMHVPEDYADHGGTAAMDQDMVRFFVRHFPK
jgi:acetyl esterase/lipase